MTKVEVHCPTCGKQYRVDESRLGREVACAKCKKQFVLSDGRETESEGESSEVDETMGVQSPAESTDEQSQLPAPSIAPDSTVAENRFEILGELGAGAFGMVYKAHDTQLDRDVALKIPKFGALGTDEDAQRFLREARAAGNLRHPNIVPIYDAGRIAGSYFIASGFIEGEELGSSLEDNRRLEPKEAVLLIKKLADALHYAHDEGVIHRDMKPANVIVSTKGEPMILDFGMARRDEGELVQTQEGARLGTPIYMSPEQHAGENQKVDGRSDQWALGVMLYEMLTGQRPFQAPNVDQLAYAVRKTEPDRPRKLNPKLDKDLETICLKCLEKEPKNRYLSCSALSEELSRYQRGEPIAARPITRVERTWRWCGRNPVVAGLTAAVAVVLLVGVAISTLFAVTANRQAIVAEQARASEAQRRQEVQNALVLRVSLDFG
jgi:predicted Zn finger-like uncharacterized protein